MTHAAKNGYLVLGVLIVCSVVFFNMSMAPHTHERADKTRNSFSAPYMDNGMPKQNLSNRHVVPQDGVAYGDIAR